MKTMYDMIIIGAGPSGCFMAQAFTQAGLKCLMLEAGKHFNKQTYPTNDLDANSQLYWGGGIELNKTADIGFLRPKVVGGGSIVNQALLDRFDDNAFDSWRNVSGIEFFNQETMSYYYDDVLKDIKMQKLGPELRNGNAKIFAEGFEKNGYLCDSLERGQSNCAYENGNDCIECLRGCRIDSKQSAAITILPRALKEGLRLISEFEVTNLKIKEGIHIVEGRFSWGEQASFKAGHVTLASGAIGNSRLLLNSKFNNPNIGRGFYSHPQAMSLAIYDQEINAHKGAFQTMKSSDPNFRLQNFKLENVFAPPVGIAMLLPGIGKVHQERMKRITHMACIEVAIRDQNPGHITVTSDGNLKITKELNEVDRKSLKAGQQAIHQIFKSTGAKEIIDGEFKIGLHLMGGLAIGSTRSKSVVTPNFSLYDFPKIFCADSSIFPNAPGINPSLTIMALSKMASQKIIKGIS
jgi:choline dehydrogenase-like flavoprotein